MRFGISGIRFLVSNAGGIALTIQSFDTTGFFILAYHDYALTYSGRALAVRS
jgi:hypothetical protein